jgi:hypothetical protein
MYCPHCGEGSTFGLKYCKKCGESLNTPNSTAEQAPQSPNKITSAAWAIAMAIVTISLGGIGIVFDFASNIIRPTPWGQQPHGDATMIAVMMLVFGSLTVFGSAVLLIRLFSKLLLPSDQKEQRNKKSDKSEDARYAPPQLQSHLPAAMSVTEHTTRNFEKQYKQPVTHE